MSDHKWEELKLDFKDRIKSDIPFPHLLNANSLANSVTETCQASIYKFMPEVKESKAQKSKPDRPWINLELKTKISHMYELLRISKETRLPQDYQNYKIYLNKLTMEKTKARNEYYRKKSELYGRDKSKTWQLVNEITSYKRKTKTTTIKSMVDIDGKKITDPISIVDCLNNHFASIGKTMAQKFDEIDGTRLIEGSFKLYIQGS